MQCVQITVQPLEVNKFSRDTAERIILLRHSLLHFSLQIQSFEVLLVLFDWLPTLWFYMHQQSLKNSSYMCTALSRKKSLSQAYFTSLKGHGKETLRANQCFLLTIVFFDRNLLYSLDENKVRPQDSLYWIEMVNKGSGKTDASWDFIFKNWKNITRRWRQKKTIVNPLLLFTTTYKMYNVLLY